MAEVSRQSTEPSLANAWRHFCAEGRPAKETVVCCRLMIWVWQRQCESACTVMALIGRPSNSAWRRWQAQAMSTASGQGYGRPCLLCCCRYTMQINAICDHQWAPVVLMHSRPEGSTHITALPSANMRLTTRLSKTMILT